MKKPESICVFGDSTAWGAWDLEKGGWVSRLWMDVGIREGGGYVEIYNCSVSGGTTETILERFENEARIRNCDALIFQTRGNDASYQAHSDNFLVPIEEFRANVEEIIKRAKRITDKIIFLDLKNCDESKTMPVSWADIYYTNENIQKYSKVMEEVCRDNGVLFLSIAPLETSDFTDGLHPNERGHEKIFRQVKDFLTRQIWI